MAKLYAKVEDQKGTEVHKIASELDIKVYYGSKGDSKLCLHMQIVADKKDAFTVPDVYYSTTGILKPFTLEKDYVVEALEQVEQRTQ